MKKLLLTIFLLAGLAYGADSTMVQIQGKATLNDTDVLIVSTSDTTYYKITYAQLKTLLSAIYLVNQDSTNFRTFSNLKYEPIGITESDIGDLQAYLLSVDSAALNASAVQESDLNSSNVPTDNYILSYNLATGGFTWVVDATGGSPDSSVYLTVYDAAQAYRTQAQVGTQIGDSLDAYTVTATLQGGQLYSTGSPKEWVELSAQAMADSNETEYEAVLDLQNLQGAVTDAQVPNDITITALANYAPLASPTFTGQVTHSGIKIQTHTITTDSTLAAALMYGGVFYVTEAQTITLPAIATGMSATFITVGAVAVSIDVNASDLMYLDGTALADGDRATNTSTTGDIIVFTYFSGVGWYAASGSNDGDLWTDGN